MLKFLTVRERRQGYRDTQGNKGQVYTIKEKGKTDMTWQDRPSEKKQKTK